MLRTSSTKSAEPKKGVFEVGGGGRNRAEPDSKQEVDGVDNGGGCSGDFDKIFPPSYDSRTTHLDAQDKLINGPSTSANNGRV